MRWTSIGRAHCSMVHASVGVAAASLLMGSGAVMKAQQPQQVRTDVSIEVRARFVDEGKKPIARMKVQIGRCTTGADGSEIFRALMDRDGRWIIATTDEEGRFTLRGLVPGTYCVAAQPPGSMYPDPVRLLTGEAFTFALPEKTTSLDLGERVVKIVRQ